MNREEAWRRTKGYVYDTLDGEEADEIIKALEQEPCEDAISRQQVKSDYADWFGYGYEDNWFYKHLSNIPSATPQPKYGKWVKKEYWKPLPYDTAPLDYDCYDEKTHSEKIYIYCCSECGEDEGEIKPTDKFCPNCGAKMQSR